MHDDSAHVRSKLIEIYRKLDTLAQMSYSSLVELRWACKASAQLVDLAKDLETQILILNNANRLHYLPPYQKRASDAD